MSSLPSSSYSSISGHKYEVFLSFRGEDTRKKFTDHLYAALKRKGIVTFRDDPQLKRGEEIAPELLKAIQESWCSVIVLSETYAFSGWCLEELAEIVKQKKERGHKKTNRKVEEAFALHEERYKEDKEKIQRWRTALTEVTNIAGWDSKDRHEAEFIECIVEEIYSGVPRQLIGPIFHSKEFMPSESSTLTFNQIINALNTDGVNMIGLYGMPGVGKTTLAKEVQKHAREKKLFDYIVMVTMSQNPNIKTIQKGIADSLRLKFEASTEEGKAVELWQRLKAVNKILIVIDDVWKKFNLQTIGIPFGAEHEGCKILLTMRLQQVCVRMDCQKKFELCVLSNSEAWALFKDKADLKDDASTLNKIAREVASECKGLPLAIVTIGAALKGESPDGWIAANKRFKDSRHLDNEDVCEGEEGPITAFSNLVELNISGMHCLKELWHGQTWLLLSKLTSLELRLLPELESIWKLQPTHQYHNASLLSLKVVTIEYCPKLKSIFSASHAPSLLHLKQLEISSCEELEKIFDFPQEMAEFEKNQIPPLSNLTSLELNDLPTLKWIWKGPTHLVTLNSRKTMRINKCLKLDYLFSTFLAKSLVHLEVLEIDSCNSLLHLIIEVENEDHVKALHWPKLKTLCIKKCGSLKYVFPITLAQGLPNLELVEICDCFQLKHVFNMTNEKGGHRQQDSLLLRLQILRLDNLWSFCPENFIMSSVLFKEFRVLNCPLFTEQIVQTNLKEWLCDAKKVAMDGVSCHKNLIPELFSEGLNELTSLILKDGKYLECLIDTTDDESHVSTSAFSNLVELEIQNMRGFKVLCNGPFPKGSLQKLEKLEIRNCMELVSLSSMRQNQKNQIPPLSNLASLELNDLPALTWTWKEPIHLVTLNNLKTMRINKCLELSYLFTTSLAKSLVHLEVLKIYSCNSLLHVIIEDENEETDANSLHWPKLRTLCIKKCESLKYVFPITLAQGLPNLELVEICDCFQLRHFFNMTNKKGGHRQQDILLQRLKFLRLTNLDNLCNFCPENFILSSVSFKEFRVLNCPLFTEQIVLTNLKEWLCDAKKVVMDGVSCHKNLIPELFSEGLNVLTSLTLKDGKYLECLIDTTDDESHVSTGAFSNLVELVVQNMRCFKVLCSGPFPKDSLQKLKKLEIRDCMELVSLSSMPQNQAAIQAATFQNLRDLTVCNCNRLKSLFSPLLAQNLLQLTTLIIMSCEGLEEIIAIDDQTSIASLSSHGHLQSKSFPALIELELSNLPSLKSFVPIGYHFQFPYLIKLRVDRCPNSVTSFSKDSKDIVHATQAPQQVEYNTAESFTTMIYQFWDNPPTCNNIFWDRKCSPDTLSLYIN
ncbi:hypothetical protein PTKIN_Ptkin14bG0048500 [Pterospermum kingtungense]